MRIIRLKYLIIALLCTSMAVAQSGKLDRTIKTNRDVTVNIDARHTQVLVEHWDKNEVQVSAFIEAKDKSTEDVKKALEAWKVDVSGSATEVKITSHGGSGFPGEMNMAALEAPLARLPEIIVPLQEMVGPLLESISGHPLPPEFHASMGEIKFDYERYKKDGEKYLKEFEKKVDKNFGKDFEVAMEKWAKNFERDAEQMKIDEKRMEAMSKKIEKEMEAWGESFGKDMEEWGEEFGKEMEAWASSFASEPGAKVGPKVMLKDHSGSKKVLRVKVPRNGRIKLNVRHGEVNFSGTTSNLRGDVSHSRFTAAGISGKDTNLKVSYTPVAVKNWEYGVLNAAYVQDLKIDRVVSLKLDSNSSNVHLKEVLENGILSGSFGELKIDRLASGFQNLDITLENSELELDLPEAAYNITYNGTNSEVDYPSGLKLTSSSSYDNQKLKGYNRTQNAGGSINIHAKFSDVLLK